MAGIGTVKEALILAGMIMILITRATAQEKPGILPSEIVTTLDRDYVGWNLVDNFRVIRQPALSHLKLDTTQSNPNRVWGDFDGDGMRDYAVLIERKATSGRVERLLIVFVARGHFFEAHLLERAVHPAYIADYIWLARRGSRYYDHQEERYFHLANDSIEAVIIEKAAVTYTFDRGAFRKIFTAD